MNTNEKAELQVHASAIGQVARHVKHGGLNDQAVQLEGIAEELQALYGQEPEPTKGQYGVYDALHGEHIEFDSLEDAVKDLKATLKDQLEDGLQDEMGESFVYQRTHEVQFPITDKKENYPDGEWPYLDEWDCICSVSVNPLADAEPESVSDEKLSALRRLSASLCQGGQREIADALDEIIADAEPEDSGDPTS